MPEFVNTWWESLNFDLQVFYGIAIIAMVALILQLIMTLVFGMDDMDLSADHDSGLGVFSVRSLTAFFTGFGWTGVILTKEGVSLPLTIFISLLVGGGLMLGIYVMMRSFMRLQSSGNIDFANAIGQTGTVYLTIPADQKAGGQVETMVQGRLVTVEALQKGSEPISPGDKIKIVDQVGSSTLIVEPLS
ncbi:MAG: NfeD family protein [Akkermansiaceae bacterium]